MSRYKAGIMKPGFNPLAAVAAGAYNNSLYAWGRNGSGQFGQSNLTNRSSPIQVGASNSWSSVSAGYAHVLAIKTDGTLWTWGGPDYGKLGQNTTSIASSSPVQVGALNNWSKVSAGYNTSAAIKTDGTLWTWGATYNGQLGLSLAYIGGYATPDISSPTQVGSLTTWLSVSAGYNHMAAIKTDGTLWAWGQNIYGSLGQNNKIYRSSPVQVGSLTNWSKVSVGGYHTIAIKTDGTLWVWGANETYGIHGLNVYGDVRYSSPTQVGSLTNWASVTTRYTSQYVLATKTDGTLWSWGYNGSGQLGLNDLIDRSSPVQVGALSTWLSVAVGPQHSSAIKTDGTLWAWGDNNFGQLGQNNLIYRSSPTQVGSLTTWTLVDAGEKSIFASI